MGNAKSILEWYWQNCSQKSLYMIIIYFGSLSHSITFSFINEINNTTLEKKFTKKVSFNNVYTF